MPWFRVLVRGEHFKINVSGQNRYMGFFVTRFVEVETSDLADAAAIAAVRSDDKLNGIVLNASNDPPRLFSDEVEQVSRRDVPDMPHGFTVFEEETTSGHRGTLAPPPYLVIREQLSCWVETRQVHEWTVTPQSFSHGCFQNAWLYDANGHLWPIINAELDRRPTIVNHLMPWRQLPVRMGFGSCLKSEVKDVLIKLSRILETKSEFSENLDMDPREILESLKRARTPLGLIQIAEKTIGT